MGKLPMPDRVNVVLYQLLYFEDNHMHKDETGATSVTSNTMSKSHLVSRRYMARVMDEMTREGLLSKRMTRHWNNEPRCVYSLSTLGSAHAEYISTFGKRSIDRFLSWKREKVTIWSEIL